MKKIILTTLVALLSLSTLPAQADDQQVLAIIDTAVDSDFTSNIIYEACFTVANQCPNGMNRMEGKGAAKVPAFNVSGKSGSMDHAQGVVSAAIKTNPNLKILFIRIAQNNARNEGVNLREAMVWLSLNATKYSVDAVSISQADGVHTLGTCKDETLGIKTAVETLRSFGVITFAATGNNSNKKAISSPACIPGVYPVTAVDPSGKVAKSANIRADVVLAGMTCILKSQTTCDEVETNWPRKVTFSGTSIATPIVASALIAKANGQSMVDLINSLPKVNGYAIVK